jgi:putative transcriptional regulator
VRTCMAVVSRFRILLAEKEVKERRTISLATVAGETGISIYTITAFARNTLREAPLDVLDTLCRYFGCDVCDILSWEPNDGAEKIAVPDLAALA